MISREECVAREAEPESIAKTAYGCIFAELTHGNRVILLFAEQQRSRPDLQQINRKPLNVSRNALNMVESTAHSSGDDHDGPRSSTPYGGTPGPVAYGSGLPDLSAQLCR